MSSMNTCGGIENELEGGGTEVKHANGAVRVNGERFKQVIGWSKIKLMENLYDPVEKKLKMAKK